MEATYRAILLCRRRDQGVDAIGNAVDGRRWERLIDREGIWSRDRCPGSTLYATLDRVMAGKRQQYPLEVALDIIRVAEHQRLIQPEICTIVAYRPLDTALRIYCYDREIDHQDGSAMLRVADDADATLCKAWSKATPMRAGSLRNQ